jgi:antirestriction protein ArdC
VLKADSHAIFKAAAAASKAAEYLRGLVADADTERRAA